MQLVLLNYICCPLTRLPLRLTELESTERQYGHQKIQEVMTGILQSEAGTFYPIINGVPRLVVEALWDYEAFFKKYLNLYEQVRSNLLQHFPTVLPQILKKNKRIKKSFSVEWGIYDYESDNTWHLDEQGMIEQFLKESGETEGSIQGKTVIDVGCGNGVLTNYIGNLGTVALGMDMSLSIERAFENNTCATVYFLQGDLQFPPLKHQLFDLVHSSGVIHHTNNTELSFSIIHELVAPKGKLSVWLYHPQNANWVHRIMNAARRYTAQLPIGLQYRLYQVFILPPVLFYRNVIKRKGINWREQMVDLMDALSPEYRYEHGHEEAKSWYVKRGYYKVHISTENQFGFSIFGTKA